MPMPCEDVGEGLSSSSIPALLQEMAAASLSRVIAFTPVLCHGHDRLSGALCLVREEWNGEDLGCSEQSNGCSAALASRSRRDSPLAVLGPGRHRNMVQTTATGLLPTFPSPPIQAVQSKLVDMWQGSMVPSLEARARTTKPPRPRYFAPASHLS